MIKRNERIIFSGTELIEALKEIELILISLHKMGSYYATQYHEGNLKKEKYDYEKETTQFIDQCKVTQRLAKVRQILSEKFDRTLGDDDMDDLERAMEGIVYWEKPGDNIVFEE